MSDANFQIKIGVETQLAQLKAMEAQFEKQIVQLRTLGTGGADALKKVESNLSLVRSELVKTASASGATGATAGMAFKGVGQAVGQAGYQMQDFAVQVAGGQSALTAFAQQGSQLLGIFGPTGIIAGAVLAVGVLAVKMLDLGANTESTTKKFKTQEEAIAALLKANRALRDINDPTGGRQTAAEELAKANQEYKKQSDIVSNLEGKLQAAEARKAADAASPLVGGFQNPAVGSSYIDGLKKKIAEARQNAVNLLPAVKEAQAAVLTIEKGLATAKAANEDASRSDIERIDFMRGQQVAAEELDQTQSSEYIERAGKIAALEKKISDEQFKDVGKLAREQINLQINVEDSQRKQIQNVRKLSELEAKELADKAAKAALSANELKLKNEQLAAARKISTGDAAISNLKNDPLALNETKRKGEIALYAEQNRYIKERIDLLNKERLSASDTRRGQIDSEVSGLNTKADGNNISSVNAQAKSIGAGATQGAVEYLNSIPDAAGRASVAVLSVAQGMENGIGSSLQGLINRTMTWGQALANIGQSIVDSIIGAFVRMAAQWITQQIVMAVFGNAIRAAQLAALLPVTAATLAMWAPAATAASIATMGGAAITGAAASKAAIISSVAGFADGGLITGPGSGRSDSIPAWLSNGEYVMPADKTAQYRPLLDSMRAGTLNPGQLAAAPGGGGGGGSPTLNSSVNMAFFDSRASAEQWAKSSEGEAHLVDVMQRNLHRISNG